MEQWTFGFPGVESCREPFRCSLAGKSPTLVTVAGSFDHRTNHELYHCEGLCLGHLHSFRTLAHRVHGFQSPRNYSDSAVRSFALVGNCPIDPCHSSLAGCASHSHLPVSLGRPSFEMPSSRSTGLASRSNLTASFDHCSFDYFHCPTTARSGSLHQQSMNLGDCRSRRVHQREQWRSLSQAGHCEVLS